MALESCYCTANSPYRSSYPNGASAIALRELAKLGGDPLTVKAVHWITAT
ncbi:hypothetical protein OK016_06430 [Vibrio chagasii]|nr:hypothetical protein [Vibrio chagasii]